MIADGHNSIADPLVGGLIRALHELATDPPDRVADQIFARWCRVEGPAGELFVAVTELGVCFVRPAEMIGYDVEVFRMAFRARFGRPLLPASRPPAGLLPALRSGRTGGVALDLRGCSGFEREVLAATARIPCGQTRPYSWIAREISRPGAVRAVGTALARNPVPVLVPCHRVTRSDGTPGDYMFGTAAKERLLGAEGVDLARVRELAGAGIFFLGSDTTRVFCFPTCHNARRITPDHRADFRRSRDAVAAGYRPCRHCRPGAAAA